MVIDDQSEQAEQKNKNDGLFSLGLLFSVGMWAGVRAAGSPGNCSLDGSVSATMFSAVVFAVFALQPGFVRLLRGGGRCRLTDVLVLALFTLIACVTSPFLALLLGVFSPFVGAACGPWQVIDAWEPWICFSLFSVGISIIGLFIFVRRLVGECYHIARRCRCFRRDRHERLHAPIAHTLQNQTWDSAMACAVSVNLFRLRAPEEKEPLADDEASEQFDAKLYIRWQVWLAAFAVPIAWFSLPMWWRHFVLTQPLFDNDATAIFVCLNNVFIGLLWAMALLGSVFVTVGFCHSASIRAHELISAAARVETVEHLEAWNGLMHAWYNETRTRTEMFDGLGPSTFGMSVIFLISTALSSLALTVFMLFPRGAHLVTNHSIVVVVVFPPSVIGVLLMLYVVWRMTGLHTLLNRGITTLEDRGSVRPWRNRYYQWRSVISA